MADVRTVPRTEDRGEGKVARRPPRLFRFAPLTLVLLAGYAIISARGLEVGSMDNPGPGAWPLMTATLLGGTAAILVVTDIPGDYENWNRGTVKVALGVIVLGAFIALLPVLGFLVATFVLLLVWLRGMAREAWRLSVLLAIVGAVVMYCLFDLVLAVPLPEGLPLFSLPWER